MFGTKNGSSGDFWHQKWFTLTPKLSQMIENMIHKLIQSWFILVWRDPRKDTSPQLDAKIVRNDWEPDPQTDPIVVLLAS
jgi:hypothetical protein